MFDKAPQRQPVTLLTLFIFALSLVYFLGLQFQAAWNYTVDDAFITLRYSKHLVEHQAFIWNVGEPVIEGYSNFLYVLLGALFIKLGLTPILMLKLISSIGVLLSMHGVYLLSRLWLPPVYAFLAPLILLMHPGELIWGVSGLETANFQALTLYATYFVLRSFGEQPKENTRSWLIASGFTYSLVALMRPEGPMLFLISLLLLCCLKQTNHIKRVTYFSLSFSALYLPYFIWHYTYFGRLFPNSVYCKALNAPAGPFELDLSYLLLILPLTLLSLPYLRKHLDRRFWFLVLPSAGYLIGLYNADWVVGYLDRHFLTAYALVLPIFVSGMVYLLSHPKVSITPAIKHLQIIVFSLLAGYLFTSHQYTLFHYAYLANSAKDGNQLRMDVANWLNKQVKPNETVTLGDCGLIPYYYGGNVIDTYCLNNLDITQAPINYSYRRFTQWLLDSKKPDYIILLALITRQKAFYPPSDFILQKSPVFARDYHEIKRFVMGQADKAGYKYVIYQKYHT